MEFRSITPDEFRAYASVWERTFNFDGKDEELEEEAKAHELDRSIVAVENGEFVGTGGAFSFEMTTPGGSVPAAGLTAIAVLPTHRRKGILTAMMRQHFEDVREREEPVAILRASESVIYGRFGYGIASYDSKWKVNRAQARLGSTPAGSGVVGLIEKDRARRVLPEVYRRAAPSIPGFLSRGEASWNHYFLDFESWRGGFTSNRFAVYEEDGEALGYLRYRVKDTWEDSLPRNEVLAAEMITITPEAEAELWRYIFATDLTQVIKTQNRPSQELIDLLLAEPRQLSRKLVDGLWARLMDVPAALGARRYRSAGKLTLRVEDEFLPECGGTFRLEGGMDGAECHPTGDNPDLTVDARALGARYLGLGSFEMMLPLGLVSGSIESVRSADSMFDWFTVPWCPHYF